MSKTRVLTLSLIVLWLSFAYSGFGNGGVFESSLVHQTGALVPMQKQSISLEEERLYVRMEEDDASVSVDYELLNRGSSDSVTFGFPVDVVAPDSVSLPNGYDYVLGNSFRDFEVKDGIDRVAITEVVDKPLPVRDRPPNIDPKLQLIRRWSMMTLKFERGERKELHVNYKVRCTARDKGFEGDIDWMFGRRSFFYTFRPAATWGNGRVKNLNIELDIHWLREHDVPVANVAPKGGSEENGRITWRFRNADLSKVDDLTCSYDPSAPYLDAIVKRNLIDPKRVKSIRASSVLPPEGLTHYDEAAMLDKDLRTAWVDGAVGSGIGERIRFEPNDAYVTDIAILNGYVVDESRYSANARIKKLRVELEFSRAGDLHGKHFVKEVDLPDRPYKTFNPHYPISSADWILQYPQGEERIRKVTLTILDTYPGRQYEDTAITELYICGFK